MTILSAVGKIHILSGEVVSRIAAGEVIERPAAVVKELIDNSIDAGSARITIEVTDGGREMIRVTDDGEGMSHADAPVAFQRHATSKLHTERDLFSIETMGFRGEALPSIASVSHVRVRTASRTDSVGTQLFLTGGLLTRQEDTAGVPGTQVEVTELFFNTPVRKKFLKTTATEFSHICQVVQRSAIAWPRVQFSLKHNGQDVLDYPLVESRYDRILQVYGSRVVGQMTAVRSERPGIRLEGMAVKAVHARATRSPQELFVNRRPVRNTTVTHAVYDGYGSSLAKGCHPVYVLCLAIEPTRVDVNVHPTKREVRFADQDLIHQTIRQGIRDAVGAEHPVDALAQPNTDRVMGEQRRSTGAMVHGWTKTQDPHPLSSQVSTSTADESCGTPSLLTREAPHTYVADPPCHVVPFGQVNQTFLVAQVGHELQVIDQHTAHERVLFERLWRAWVSQSVPTQTLLIPESIEAPPHAAALIHEHLSDLARLGLDIEPFGGKSFVVRAVPALLGHLDYAGLVQDLADDLTQWNSTTSLETKIRPVLASLACHAAVRAGRTMAQPEMKQLIDDWLQEGQPATCPHGRRIALRFSADELAKIFGRA